MGPYETHARVEKVLFNISLLFYFVQPAHPGPPGPSSEVRLGLDHFPSAADGSARVPKELKIQIPNFQFTMIPTDSINEASWLLNYTVLKGVILSHRSKGEKVAEQEVKALKDQHGDLQRHLQRHAGSPMQYELSSGEIARRQVIIGNLQKQLLLLSAIGKNQSSSPPQSSRPSLGSSPPSNRPSISQHLPPEMNSSFKSVSEVAMNPLSQTSERGLVQRQQEVIKMQDDMLKDIEKGVGRLHDQALTIGEEAKLHVKILNKLDDQVDKTTDDLKREARHAERIRVKSRVCAMYMCIVGEIIIIVILLVVWFSTQRGKNQS